MNESLLMTQVGGPDDSTDDRSNSKTMVTSKAAGCTACVSLMLLIGTLVAMNRLADGNTSPLSTDNWMMEYGATSPSVTPTTTYGLDISWPIQGPVSTNYPSLPHNRDPLNYPTPPRYRNMPLQVFGDDRRHKAYLEHLDGCRRHYARISAMTSRICDIYDYDRILMNKRQPQSMQNYTEVGFLKIQAPQRVKDLIEDFWNKNRDKQVAEVWPEGNIYVNHWSSPTRMVSVDDQGLRGSGYTLKRQIWDAAQATLQKWTNQDITPVSMYGIRVYTEGAVLVPHVDRLPLVASAMVNVAQDVDEDWPMEIYSHDGQAHNVTLKPGEMLLFESHSVVHGRPFPLKGRYYAMLFMHFEPTGHVVANQTPSDIDEQYKKAAGQGVGGPSSSEQSRLLPPYIRLFSPEEEHWQREHPEGWVSPASAPSDTYQQESTKDVDEFAHLQPKEHQAAREGNIQALEVEISRAGNNKSASVNKRDDNGWQPIHEGAFSGIKEVVELLINHGADVNSRTNGGRGGTPLYLVQKRFGRKHSIVRYLESLGALDIPPDNPKDEL